MNISVFALFLGAAPLYAAITSLNNGASAIHSLPPINTRPASASDSLSVSQPAQSSDTPQHSKAFGQSIASVATQ